MTSTVETLQPVYRFFTASVARTERLSPSFLRVTLTGPEMADFGFAGDDQRFKLILPNGGESVGDLLAAAGPDWYVRYCAMPEETRPHLRTYTARAFRPEVAELDVDVVLHGIAEDGTPDAHAGPAATWAASAIPGSEIVLLGPDRPGTGRGWGVEWTPPIEADTLFLAGDETAVPAIAGILESLEPGPRVVAVLEVPEAGDFLPLHLPAGADVRWLARGSRPRGEQLGIAVHTALCELGIARSTPGVDPDDVDLTDGILWEVPEAGAHTRCYAWLAGEAGVVKKLRRHLVRDLNVPREAVAFMGYWREGSRG
ncbi:siderophore-interacting protein [Geodermatophilaceae bacterium NBWT11]|nr:siderophore-interacting protein [Geodermatophilaceae bacterium NBWT11]